MMRTHATPKVAPITRAIRNAMAVSATVLALSGSGLAQAGVRSHVAATMMPARAAATSPRRPDIAPVDLTRIEGGAPPTSVLAFAAPTAAAFGQGGIESLTEIDNSTDLQVNGYGGDVCAVCAFDDLVTVDNSADITAWAAPIAAGGYAQAIGVRAAGYTVEVDNAAGGLIGATAVSDGGAARARAVYATGYFDAVSVDNQGDLQAYARANGGQRADAHGVYAFGYGSATHVGNAGTIEVTAQSDDGAGYATGITSIGYGQGDNLAEVVNTGDITAEANAAYAYAFGVLNLTRQQAGSAALDNGGDITATATGDFATATGVLNLALRYGDATTTNTGSIVATADGSAGGAATGIYSYATVYNASVTNAGGVSATGSGDIALATGIDVATPMYGTATVLNQGDVAAHAYAGTGLAQAVGVHVESGTSVDLTTYGSIDAVATTAGDSAFAAGVYAVGAETTTVRNYGGLSATAESGAGYAIAYGVSEYGGFAGTGLMINGGTIDVVATTGAGSQAHATGVNVVADVASVFNDASIHATATAGDGGLADARAARAYGDYSAVSSYGDLTASASADGGVALARGADALGYNGASVYNAGNIAVDATAVGGLATATGSYAVGYIFSAYTTNNGSIAATAAGDSATAYGALNVAAYLGAAITTNSGSISAVADGGIAPYGVAEATAFGIYNLALIYDSVVDNSGTIAATASATTDISGTDGFLQAKAIGIEAINAYGYRDAAITNAGYISATAQTSQGYASAWGVAAVSSGAYGGAARIDNAGTLTTHAHADVGIAYATGAYAINQGGDAEVVNSGDIRAYSRVESGLAAYVLDYAYATGIKAVSQYGNTTVTNDGALAAHASGYGAITGGRGIQAGGVYTSVLNAAGASIVATGEVDQFGGGFATGIEATGIYGVDVVNDGDIGVYGHAHAWDTHYGAAQATGIYASAGYQGNVSVTNNGSITAQALAEDSLSFAQGGAGAVGINAYAKYDATVVNHGDITATAQAQFGIAGAYGVIGHGKYSTNVINAAGASIVAEATVGSSADDGYGGRAVSFGTHVFGDGMDHAVVYNAGSIVSHATVTSDAASANPSLAKAWGASAGAYSNIRSGTIVNVGDIEAAASADFGYATAYGSYLLAGTAATTRNGGAIRASAQAAHGNAWAVGSLGVAVEQVYDVPCELVDGPYGPYYSCDYSNAHWIITGGDASLDNSGSIAAVAQAAGGVGYSYGATMLGGATASLTNTGRISAVSEADDARAVGAVVNAMYGGASVTNHGDILASATGATAQATGVIALGATGAQVDNSGRILAGAYGDAATAAALSFGDTGSNVLTNAGTIGAYGDGLRIAVASGSGATASLGNSGTLIGAIRTGDLADSLDNAATGTWTALGDSDFGAGDDRIVNLGTIGLHDASVALGADAGDVFGNDGRLFVAGADNRIAATSLANNGVLSFGDGTADDRLTLVGDLTGAGQITVDVNGLSQSADQLYVDGQVSESASQILNINLVALPTTASFLVPVIAASGSLGGEFALGRIQQAQGGFVTLDFGLSRTGSTLAVSGEVTGLDATGSVAAAVAPGVQSLVNAQIGSWRQRTGALDDGGHGWTPWLRAFSDNGGVVGSHTANFGAGGSFDFQQSNHGMELGVAFWPTEHLALGALLAQSQGSQRVTGAGRDRFDGDSTGLFATWRGDNGFYLDLSHRWFDVDARLSAPEGAFDTNTSARALNLEAGVTAWTTAGGLHVVPQLQVTRTRVHAIDALQTPLATFSADGGQSSRGRLGVALDKSFQGARVTWTTYGALSAVREFDGRYDHAINGSLQGSTRTDGTSAMVELGVGAQRGHLSVSGGLHWTDGGAVDSTTGGQLEVRYTW